tara:strand:+ start:1067 stop:1273 length:207 start_codon:yes stop_codon:yes gene_type:complete
MLPLNTSHNDHSDHSYGHPTRYQQIGVKPSRKLLFKVGQQFDETKTVQSKTNGGNGKIHPLPYLVIPL